MNKQIFSLLLTLFLLMALTPLAGQTSRGFSYQAIARDASGGLLDQTTINIRFQVIKGSNNGTLEYQEVHDLTTNSYGLFSTTVGKGSPELGDFNTIDWGSDEFLLVVELNGIKLDTSLLESVPYAKVATDMGLVDLKDVDALSPGTNQVLKWDGNNWIPSQDEVIDGDADDKNELQSLALSGTTLSISSGNSVTLPTGTAYTAGTGIDISGNVISNTSPDQTVNLASGGATSISGSYPNFTISSTDNVDDADSDPNNELQSLSISGNNLSISGGNSVALPSVPTYSGGTGISVSGSTITNTAPDQTVSLSGAGATSISGSYPNFTISSTDNVDDADADAANELQTLSLSSNTLSLSQGGGSVSLASFATPWTNSGSDLYFNSGKVGIGDNSPLATFTVGNGDKFQVKGSDGDLTFTDDEGSIQFANAVGSNAPMMYMFRSGVNNATRMLVAHSPNYTDWGIQYNDTADAYTYLGDGIPVMRVQLGGQQRVGLGTAAPEGKLHVLANTTIGVGHLKLTEVGVDFSRITMNNNVHNNNNYWDIAARADTNLANSQFNIFNSQAGDLFSVNARGRVGINDAFPGFPLEVNGKGYGRTIYAYNQLPTTTSTTYGYGVFSSMSQASNTGFPRLYSVYGTSTDSDAFVNFGIYGVANNASQNNYAIYGYTPTTEGYAVYAAGNMYCTGSYLPSDSRLKTGVSSIQRGLSTVMSLQPKTYQYKQEEYESLNLPEQKQYGFVAQELQAVLPELTRETFHPYEEALSDTEKGQGIWFTSVNYIGLVPILVAGMQEQQGIIEQQDQRISDQEQKIQDLEARLAALEEVIKSK